MQIPSFLISHYNKLVAENPDKIITWDGQKFVFTEKDIYQAIYDEFGIDIRGHISDPEFLKSLEQYEIEKIVSDIKAKTSIHQANYELLTLQEKEKQEYINTLKAQLDNDFNAEMIMAEDISLTEIRLLEAEKTSNIAEYEKQLEVLRQQKDELDRLRQETKDIVSEISYTNNEVLAIKLEKIEEEKKRVPLEVDLKRKELINELVEKSQASAIALGQQLRLEIDNEIKALENNLVEAEILDQQSEENKKRLIELNSVLELKLSESLESSLAFKEINSLKNELEYFSNIKSGDSTNLIDYVLSYEQRQTHGTSKLSDQKTKFFTNRTDYKVSLSFAHLITMSMRDESTLLKYVDLNNPLGVYYYGTLAQTNKNINLNDNLFKPSRNFSLIYNDSSSTMWLENSVKITSDEFRKFFNLIELSIVKYDDELRTTDSFRIDMNRFNRLVDKYIKPQYEMLYQINWLERDVNSTIERYEFYKEYMTLTSFQIPNNYDMPELTLEMIVAFIEDGNIEVSNLESNDENMGSLFASQLNESASTVVSTFPDIDGTGKASREEKIDEIDLSSGSVGVEIIETEVDYLNENEIAKDSDFDDIVNPEIDPDNSGFYYDKLSSFEKEALPFLTFPMAVQSMALSLACGFNHNNIQHISNDDVKNYLDEALYFIEYIINGKKSLSVIKPDGVISLTEKRLRKYTSLKNEIEVIEKNISNNIIIDKVNQEYPNLLSYVSKLTNKVSIIDKVQMKEMMMLVAEAYVTIPNQYAKAQIVLSPNFKKNVLNKIATHYNVVLDANFELTQDQLLDEINEAYVDYFNSETIYEIFDVIANFYKTEPLIKEGADHLIQTLGWFGISDTQLSNSIFYKIYGDAFYKKLDQEFIYKSLIGDYRYSTPSSQREKYFNNFNILLGEVLTDMGLADEIKVRGFDIVSFLSNSKYDGTKMTFSSGSLGKLQAELYQFTKSSILTETVLENGFWLTKSYSVRFPTREYADFSYQQGLQMGFFKKAFKSIGRFFGKLGKAFVKAAKEVWKATHLIRKYNPFTLTLSLAVKLTKGIMKNMPFLPPVISQNLGLIIGIADSTLSIVSEKDFNPRHLKQIWHNSTQLAATAYRPFSEANKFFLAEARKIGFIDNGLKFADKITGGLLTSVENINQANIDVARGISIDVKSVAFDALKVGLALYAGGMVLAQRSALNALVDKGVIKDDMLGQRLVSAGFAMYSGDPSQVIKNEVTAEVKSQATNIITKEVVKVVGDKEIAQVIVAVGGSTAGSNKPFVQAVVEETEKEAVKYGKSAVQKEVVKVEQELLQKVFGEHANIAKAILDNQEKIVNYEETLSTLQNESIRIANDIINSEETKQRLIADAEELIRKEQLRKEAQVQEAYNQYQNDQQKLQEEILKAENDLLNSERLIREEQKAIEEQIARELEKAQDEQRINDNLQREMENIVELEKQLAKEAEDAYIKVEAEIGNSIDDVYTNVTEEIERAQKDLENLPEKIGEEVDRAEDKLLEEWERIKDTDFEELIMEDILPELKDYLDPNKGVKVPEFEWNLGPFDFNRKPTTIRSYLPWIIIGGSVVSVALLMR